MTCSVRMLLYVSGAQMQVVWLGKTHTATGRWRARSTVSVTMLKNDRFLELMSSSYPASQDNSCIQLYTLFHLPLKSHRSRSARPVDGLTGDTFFMYNSSESDLRHHVWPAASCG